MTWLATFWDLALEHVASFIAGVFVGFILSNRYRLVRRDDG